MLKVADVVREITHTRRNRQASEEQYQPFLDKSTQTGCQKYLEEKEIVFNTS
jgi:hypothetical protein